MWVLKSDFDKLVIQYNKYFNVKEKVKDYLDLKKKVIKKLRKKSQRELKNLELKLTIESSKKGTNWDSYVGLRLANIAIVISVITTILQYYPESLEYGKIFLVFFLVFGALYLYTFSYRDEKMEDNLIFMKFLLSCVSEILQENNKK
ncbi:MAG: hypothetical protein E6248_10065 [Clostridium sp.]|uniref:hypothetical protein n=1 Tax=Clostridium sp. TaxID=1506 RepID=UPI0029107828|nr:hypothetical protein [Clostridium sp.]MDU5110783.1 hypothetical protein [Clostridium sp.]